MAYLTLTASQSGSRRDETLKKAEKYAHDARQRAEDIPALFTYSQALLAYVRLLEKKPDLALQLATNAIDHLESAGHLEECEALIHLVYARSLHENGKIGEALAKILGARDWLLKQATSLRSDWRSAYLEAIPDMHRS